ncbi:hypothetical protein [Leucobacter luti]|uniref:hypothetical protein n=1 Tax=Leucobacter luti TaxID=340320 RepID=UPI003CFCBADF
MTWFTYREAAARVHRSTRTIKRWRRDGLPMTFDKTGRRIVEERTLLTEYRRRLAADPVHQQRIRSMTGDTPSDELLDQLSVSPPTVSVE